MDDDPIVNLARWSGPWSDDDPDANLKADVALYGLADPLKTVEGLSASTGIPVGALVRYVLARWASEGVAGLLELGPTFARRLHAVVETAENAGSDDARLAAYRQLAEMISWVVFPLTHPDVHAEASERIEAARSLTAGDDAREFYDRWAVNYDRDVYDVVGVTGTDRVVERVAALVAPSATVLDAGCGTGAVGTRLVQHGFTCVEGVDLSGGMLKIAANTRAYGDVLQCDLTQPLPFRDASFDAVASAGTFVTGHVNADALTELARITKPGGHLVFTVMEAHWVSGGFGETIHALDREGLAHVISDDAIDVVVGSPVTKRLITLRRSASGSAALSSVASNDRH